MTISFFHGETPRCDLIVIPLSSDNPGLAAQLEQIAADYHLPPGALAKYFKAEDGEIYTFFDREQCLALLGLGKKSPFSGLVKAFRRFSHKCRKKMPPNLAVNFQYEDPDGARLDLVEAAVNGLLLGGYQLGRYKTEEKQEHPLLGQDGRLFIGTPADDRPAASAAQKGRVMAETQMRIFDLVNAPSNHKHPADLARWAKDSGERYGYAVRVMEKAEILETGLHALLAVNQGSAEPPVFIIMEYRPAATNDEAPPCIGLVGKGVTFDTGGLSIKPSANMHYMKSDMGGAAAVLGTMEMAAKLQLPVRLVGIIPSTDNCVDALSIKPSDVINSYSGKTIEIIDTDAEGRLILADGLSYMVKNFQPDVLIDLATLTGSAVRTFGYHAAALFTNDEALAGQFNRLGDETGERVWRLPLWDVYEEDIKSDVADVRNFSGKPMAGAIGAAKFLEVFTHRHARWVHLDIAGVAFGDSEFASQKSATAYGVRLLTEYLSNVAR